ncbi:MAG: hypothetical protein WDN28_28220 [Chthoniobacter sp.]
MCSATCPRERISTRISCACNPFLEQETSYYPTASQLVAVARAQCPPTANKTLVVLGGNSVFNGSGQKRNELWSRALQEQLGDHYQVVNFSAPGGGCGRQWRRDL